MNHSLIAVTDPHHRFLAITEASLVQQLQSRHRMTVDDAKDAAATAVVKLLPNVTRALESYPSAQVYAGAVARSTVEDFFRAQRAQRGEGARLVTDPRDATRQVTKRTVVALNDEAVRHRDTLDLEAEVVEEGALEALLSGLAPFDRRLVRAIAVDGYTVSEVAYILGLTRETVSRRYHRCLRKLRAHLGDRTQPLVAA
jgi:RNA polymerase sigma factor (sigma-70 family)